jgi:hypothetical protein
MLSLAGSTFFLAVVTGISVIISGVMACLTHKAIKQSQKHHEEDSMPLLFMDIYQHEGLLSTNFINPITAPKDKDRVSVVKNMALLEVDATLSNIGLGPALNIRLVVTYESNQRMRLICDIGSLSSLSERHMGRLMFKAFPDSCFLDLSGNFKVEEYIPLALKPWRLELFYDDAFGNTYSTAHDKIDFDNWTKFNGMVNKPSIQ